MYDDAIILIVVAIILFIGVIMAGLTFRAASQNKAERLTAAEIFSKKALSHVPHNAVLIYGIWGDEGVPRRTLHIKDQADKTLCTVIYHDGRRSCYLEFSWNGDSYYADAVGRGWFKEADIFSNKTKRKMAKFKERPLLQHHHLDETGEDFLIKLKFAHFSSKRIIWKNNHVIGEIINLHTGASIIGKVMWFKENEISDFAQLLIMAHP